MNAKGIAPKAKSRLNRIKYVSRFLKCLIISYFVGTGIAVAYGIRMNGLGQTVAPPVLGMSTKENLYNALFSALNLLAVIALYRLLSFYEQGVMFSAANTSQIRRLGYLAMAYSLLKACGPLLLPMHGVFSVLAASINFLLSPWFFAGCLVIIVTWIMDEGRKMQEEQQLTI
jgi:hypothetical protein